ADAHPRSYAASPLRPARPGVPEVVVKRRHGGAIGAVGATAVAPTPGYRRTLRAARLRGAALLLGSLTMVTLVGLAMAGVLPRWSALAGVAAGALAFALVRWSVARRRAAIRRARSAGARPRSATPRTGRVAQPASRPAPARPASVPRHHPAASRSRAPEGHEFAAQSVAV